jgi:hypothetical protein
MGSSSSSMSKATQLAAQPSSGLGGRGGETVQRMKPPRALIRNREPQCRCIKDAQSISFNLLQLGRNWLHGVDEDKQETPLRDVVRGKRSWIGLYRTKVLRVLEKSVPKGHTLLQILP